MSRNRRHQSAAIRFGPALKSVALCLLIGGSAVGYVWQKDQIRQLGERIAEGEQTLDRLRRQNEELRRDLLTLRSPANLERLAQQKNLGLVRPAPDQVIWLPEPGPLPSASQDLAVPTHYAANEVGRGWPR
ncbi:MAG: cell division protein FtsL [Verrucomicrobia bacterium]|jgi:hypothetical protein|nr:cell division protein FtsL [Verrucomicrobiota bacterium]